MCEGRLGGHSSATRTQETQALFVFFTFYFLLFSLVRGGVSAGHGSEGCLWHFVFSAHFMNINIKRATGERFLRSTETPSMPVGRKLTTGTEPRHLHTDGFCIITRFDRSFSDSLMWRETPPTSICVWPTTWLSVFVTSASAYSAVHCVCRLSKSRCCYRSRGAILLSEVALCSVGGRFNSVFLWTPVCGWELGYMIRWPRCNDVDQLEALKIILKHHRLFLETI